MFTELLQAKLQIPQVRPLLVARPRLTNKLTQSLNARLLLVSAPAGYGKTTLVAEWLNSLSKFTIHNSQFIIHNFAWLSLDERDNDPARFLSYLLTALEPVVPGWSAGIQSQWPEPISVVIALANALADALQEGPPCILVLDDYHAISDPTIHEVLTLLIDYAPVGLHMILTTREDPPLPLSRWLTRGQLAEIRAADLRFTANEAAVFLEEVMGLSLTAEHISAVEARTEGWVAGLQLAALALQHERDAAAFLRAFSGESAAIAGYLLAEVFEQQTAETQHFLLSTAILERLTAPLCAAVMKTAKDDYHLTDDNHLITSTTSAQAQLEQLHRANLFLVALDSRGEWFQYHQLFGEFLRRQLDRRQPDRRPFLHRQAAAWFQEQRYTAEAASHWLMAGEGETAAPLVAAIILNQLQRGEIMTVRRWLEQLPETLVIQQPALALARLWLFASINQPELIAVEGTQIADVAGETPLAAETLAVMAVGAAMSFDAEESLTLARRAEAQPGLTDPFARAHVSFALAAAYKVGGAFAEAEQHFRRAETLATTAGADYLACSAAANLAAMQEEWGLLVAAEASYRHALHLAQPAPAIGDHPVSDHAVSSVERPYAGWLHWGLGNIYYQWNDLATAQHHADRSVPLCETWGNFAVATRGQLLRARIAQAHGDYGAAQSMLDYAARLARQTGNAHFAGLVLRQRLAVALRQGDRYAARHWVELARNQPDGRFRFATELAQARFALAEARPQIALNHAETARHELETMGNYLPGLLQAFILKALAYRANDQRSPARQAFERALALGEPGNFVRAFVDEGADVLALLESSAIYPAYVVRLLAAFGRDPRGGVSPGRIPVEQAKLAADTATDLTPREREILQLLATGLSNRQMAQHLVIAESTLKRHLSNLYLKLDVHSRTQALAAITVRSKD